MRVISKARLVQFWEGPAHRDAEGPLRTWHTHVNHHTIDWANWAALKAEFPTASPVGNCVVFNIGGNKYRLITRVIYSIHKVFILRVLTHQQYDQQNWREECGCHHPPPTRARSAPRKAPPLKIRRKGRRR